MPRPTLHALAIIALLVGLVGSDAAAKDETRHGFPDFPAGVAPLQAHAQASVSRVLGTMAEEAPGIAPDAMEADLVYKLVHLEFESADAAAKLDVQGIHMLARFERFVDVLVAGNTKTGRLEQPAWSLLLASEGLRWLDIGDTVPRPPPAPVELDRERARGEPEPIQLGGIGAHKGRGVVIAVVDDGLDYTHPDFIRMEDGKPVSRVLYLWDLTVQPPADEAVGKRGVLPSPYTYPDGRPIGTVYTRDALTAALRGSLGYQIPTTYGADHGTKCAGIAAGNGAAWDAWLPTKKGWKPRRANDRLAPAGSHAGVAPEADLIAVRIGRGQRAVEYATFLGVICDWLETVAAERPLVVSCSFGGDYGPKDGSLVLERQLDARFAPERVGRALCIAAGNGGAEAHHADVTFGGEDKKGVFAWDLRDAQGRSVEAVPGARMRLGIYLDEPCDPKTVRLSTDLPGGTWIQHPQQHGITNKVLCEVLLPAQPGAVEIWVADGKANSADIYFRGVIGGQANGDAPGPRFAFDAGVATMENMISSPGASAQAITVGSFDWNSTWFCRFGSVELDARFNPSWKSGQVSAYSNPGPRRDGRVKPDIVAPGQYYAAPMVSGLPISYDCNSNVDVSGRYGLMNGTSAATPYVAGVIALLFEQDPELTVGDLHRLLETHADTTIRDREKAREAWGYGKLTRAAVLKLHEAAAR